MTKPEHWYDLPFDLLDRLIEQADNRDRLSWNSYESSFQELKHQILCNPKDFIYDSNGHTLEEIYEEWTDDTFKAEIEQCIWNFEARAQAYKKYLE